MKKTMAIVLLFVVLSFGAVLTSAQEATATITPEVTATPDAVIQTADPKGAALDSAQAWLLSQVIEECHFKPEDKPELVYTVAIRVVNAYYLDSKASSSFFLKVALLNADLVKAKQEGKCYLLSTLDTNDQIALTSYLILVFKTS